MLYQTVIYHKLTSIHQLFSWTSVGSTTWSVNKATWQSEESCESPVHLIRTASLKFFVKWITFEIRQQKNANCHLEKISLLYHTVVDQRLTVINQLLSWTSVVLWKCPIDKTIGSQGYLTVSAVSSRRSFKASSFEMNRFLYQPLKNLIVLSIKLTCFFKLL